LPAGAREVGQGRYPKGHVAEKKSGLGIIDIDLTPTNMLLVGALGYMFYVFLWKPAAK
jgi:hypothetical protein